jgi:lipoprotein-releasing system ATP-binding protein
MMPGIIRGLPRGALEARAKELLDRVNLSHRITHRPSEMSGGEQQRVALARALSMRPKLLLADEPTGNLDTENSEQMNELFTRLNRDLGTTMVIVTHNERLAEGMPRVITMLDGRVQHDRRRSAETSERSASASVQEGRSSALRGEGELSFQRSEEG